MEINRDSVLITCAVRYALGRQSYMPSSVVDEIKPLLSEMSKRNLTVMRTDLKEYMEHVNNDWNYPYWLELLTEVETELERRETLEQW